MNCQLYSGWREGKRKPGVRPCGEGLVEAAGESIEVWSVEAGGSVGVRDGEGYGASVIYLGEEALGEEAFGFSEGGGNNVWEGSLDISSEGVGGWAVSDGIETVERIGERGRGFCSRVLLSGHIAGGALFAFTLWGGLVEPAV